MSRPEPEQQTAAEMAFEDLTAELEAVVARLERGDLSLDEAMAQYERGVELVRLCNELLDRAELRITQISTSLGRAAAYGPDDRQGTFFEDFTEDEDPDE